MAGQSHYRPVRNASLTRPWRLLSLVVLAMIFMAFSGTALAAPQGAPAPDAPLLVKFKASATAADVKAAIAESGGQSVRELQQIRTRVVSVPAAEADKVLAAFAKHPSVERA